MQLTAGPHVIRMTARFRAIEEAGAHLEVRNPTTGEIELLQFTPLAPAPLAPDDGTP